MKRAASRKKSTPSPVRRLLRGLFVTADVALLAVFLIGFLSAYVRPGWYTWWTEFIAIGFPYLSLLVILATGVVFLDRRWRLLGLHAIALGLIAFRFIPFGASLGRENDGGEVLQLMSFNVPNYWGDFTKEERATGMVRLARSEEVDLVALQDALVGHVPGRRGLGGELYARALHDSLGYDVPSHDPGNRAWTQQPVFGRIPIHSLQQVRLRRDPEDRTGIEVTRAEFTFDERRAVLYNLHLRSFGAEKPWNEDEIAPLSRTFWTPYFRRYRQSFLDRAWEVEEIREMLARETLPVIVCGDFNSTPHNWSHRRLVSDFDLIDAFRVAGRSWGATYHSRFPLVRIDFILVSPEWEVVSARTVDPQLSDHRAVIAGLRWRTES